LIRLVPEGKLIRPPCVRIPSDFGINGAHAPASPGDFNGKRKQQQ
jgi:hypothetical protein